MRKQISSSVLLAALIASLTSSPANAVDTRTCAQGGTCAVGDVGPGGGVVFYARVPGAFTESHTEILGGGYMGPQNFTVQVNLTSGEVAALSFDYLEAAPSSAVISGKQASTNGVSGTSPNFGTGVSNTNLYIQQFPSDTASNNGSIYASNYVNNGVSDWHLPSTDEMALLAIRHLANALGSTSPIASGDMRYWTSDHQDTFYKTSSGMYKNFGNDPFATNSVLPIRAFSSTPAPSPSPSPTTSASPTPTTSAAPVVATAAKVYANSKIKFDRSSSVLTKASKAKLKKLAKSVGGDAEIKVQAAVGPLNNASKAQMRALAKLRAKAIAKYLKSQISINQTYKIKIIDEGVKPVTSVTAN
jgi:outer membrane protein OmpA-like peptidoglycan-associated protein